jgi:NAD(P)-dependent dehydrogenase (short-subunit alcohol dehydrogenase family)
MNNGFSVERQRDGGSVTFAIAMTIPPAPPDFPLRDRVAVITGASRGIGAATARRLATDGATVVLAARTADALEALATEVRTAGGRALVIPTDLGVGGELDRLIETVEAELGRLDILVNNGGVLPPARRAERLTREAWDQVIAVNLTAPWYLGCRAHDLMIKGERPGGVIVNVSSTAAMYPSVGLLGYATSKAALTMVTRASALEWARDGVRVVAVAPGKVDTELVAPIVEYTEKNELALNPLGRLGRPEEVADLIAYLVDDRASFITGSTFTIDGGELVGLSTGI